MNTKWVFSLSILKVAYLLFGVTTRNVEIMVCLQGVEKFMCRHEFVNFD